MKSLVLILPLAGVFIGWLLSLGTKLFEFNIQDKRKLNKLLFYLLELRFHFQRAYRNSIKLDNVIESLVNRIVEKYNLQSVKNDIKKMLEERLDEIEEGVNNSIPSHTIPDYLMENIDDMLIDLAEAFPILAYELSGQHNIKERLSDIDQYVDKSRVYSPDIPIDMKEFITPKVINSLVEGLDESILQVSKKIGRKTYRLSKEKLSYLIENDDDVDTEEFDEFMEEYLNQLDKIFSGHQPT